MNPTVRLKAGIETCKCIKKLGGSPADMGFFEIGTGRAPIVPLAYWLMGARRTVTMDLNHYIKAELIKELLQYIADNGEAIQILFGPMLDENRMETLLRFQKDIPFSTEKFLELCHIDYRAPADASRTGLDNQSIDFYTSYTVLEHIPPKTVAGIFNEGNRVIRDDGLFIHRIDYSDHFAHSDPTISAVNFLQFSDARWDKYAGNRYMYMNRLRHDDFLEIIQSAGHCLLAVDTEVDKESHNLLKNGELLLDERFSSKSKETLAITASWIVSQKTADSTP